MWQKQIDAERTDQQRVVFARMTQKLAKSAKTQANNAQLQVKTDTKKLDLSTKQLHSAGKEKTADLRNVASLERDLQEANKAADGLPEAPRPEQSSAPVQPASPSMEIAQVEGSSVQIVCLKWIHKSPPIWMMDSYDKVAQTQVDVDYQVGYTRDLTGQLGWVNRQEVVKTKQVCTTDWDLMPDSQYLFRVRAKTSFGWGSWSAASLPITMPVSEWTCPMDKTLRSAISVQGSLCAPRLTLTAKHVGGWLSDIIVSYVTAAPMDSTLLGGGAMVSFAGGDARSSTPCAKALAAHIATTFATALSEAVQHSLTYDCTAQASTEFDGLHREFVEQVQQLEGSALDQYEQTHTDILNSTRQLKMKLKSFATVNPAAAGSQFVVSAVDTIQKTADLIHTSHQELQKAVSVAAAQADTSSSPRQETTWTCSIPGPVETASLLAIRRPCSAAVAVQVLEATEAMSAECSQVYSSIHATIATDSSWFAGIKSTHCPIVWGAISGLCSQCAAVPCSVLISTCTQSQCFSFGGLTI